MDRRSITTQIFLWAVVITGALTVNAQLLYKVEGNGLKVPSYIFGTHHLAPLSTLERVMGLTEAFEGCEAVVGEIDMTVNPMEMAAVMQPYMTAPVDSALSQVLSLEVYAVTSEKFRTATGLPLEAFEEMKPMVPLTVLSALTVSKAMDDFNAGDQLDTWFQQRGRETGKKIIPLETVEQQARTLYCTQSIAAQAEALVEEVDDLDRLIETSRRLNRAYAEQDIESLYRIGLDEEIDPEFMERLLTERNAEWVGRVPDLMAAGSCFIAVGALHLPGEEGVVSLLREEGYDVSPIGEWPTDTSRHDPEGAVSVAGRR